MITARPSYITRIFDELVRNSQRDGQVRRATLKGGAELVVRVAGGFVYLTIKRPSKPVGAKEIETFRRDCRVPADAKILTPVAPILQVSRNVTTRIDASIDGIGQADVPWFYVAFRWVYETP